MSSPTPVVEGPRWYRSRIRLFGPLLSVVPPGVLGGLAWLVLALFDGRWSGVFGLFGGVIAAPGLLVAGAPFGDDAHYPVAVAASLPLWLAVGVVASRRATRAPIAGWPDFWREFVWLAVGVAVGAVTALLVASTMLGETLL